MYEAFANNDLDNEDASLLQFDRAELAVAYKAIKGGANTLTKLKHTVKEFMDAKLSVMVDVLEELKLASYNKSLKPMLL